MKKLLKSKKALSPVVAAIILIAVTVAVSIAVAAWMGSLTFTFMETEELKITGVAFDTTGGSNGGMNVTVLNTGTTDVVITSATVAGLGITGTPAIIGSPVTIGKGLSVELDINAGAWSAGNAYNVELLSTKGNKFTYTANAPT
jgi:flagellin-like protein